MDGRKERIQYRTGFTVIKLRLGRDAALSWEERVCKFVHEFVEEAGNFFKFFVPVVQEYNGKDMKDVNFLC